jgi:hypothetical protein
VSLIETRSHSLPIEEEKNREQNIDWKSILNSTLATPPDAVASQRAWAALASKVREMCPETEWVFIREEESTPGEEKAISSIQYWLEALVAHIDWPFPEQVILSASHSGKDRTWNVMVKKSDGKIPYVTPSSNITVTAFKDAHTQGWKIQASNSFTLNKAGEA